MGGGYVQVNPPSLGQEVELLFSFSSINQSGVLLAAFSGALPHRQVRFPPTATHQLLNHMEKETCLN